MDKVVAERRSIDVVPDAERHGTPFSRFTLWFCANMQVTAVVGGRQWPSFSTRARGTAFSARQRDARPS